MTKPTTRLPTLFSVAEAATSLRICTKTLRKMIDAGTLPHHRIGGRILIAERDLVVYLAQVKS